MERRRHVYAGVIAVGADEADIFLREIRVDAFEKDPQQAPARFADPAPALDADMPGDLRRPRQLVKIVDGPGRLSPIAPLSSSRKVVGSSRGACSSG